MTREEAMGIIYLDLMCSTGKLATLTDDDFEEANCLKRKIEALDMAHNALKKALQERPKGRWIELPCEIGDTIWLLQKKCKHAGEKNKPWDSCDTYWNNVYKKGMWGCAGKDEDGNTLNCEKKEMVWYAQQMEYSLSLYSPNIILGKNLFLTKEEAEKALADMRESEQE